MRLGIKTRNFRIEKTEVVKLSLLDALETAFAVYFDVIIVTNSKIKLL